MYKKYVMFISFSFSMTVLITSDNNNQSRMHRADFQMKIDQEQPSIGEQALTWCIFAACYDCNYRHDGAALDLANNYAKFCIAFPRHCLNTVKSCGDSIVNASQKIQR